MTGPVGGTVQSGIDGPLQSGAARIGGGHRSQMKQSRDAKSESEETAQNTSQPEAPSSDLSIHGADKVSGRKHDKSDSDDGDPSFEDTFDGIGKQEVKTHVSAEPGGTWTPDMALAQISANHLAQGKSDSTGREAGNSQGAIRPANLLKQNSIIALMDAKSRLLPVDGDTKVEQRSEGDAIPHSQEASDAMPMIVNSHETHWNFDDKAMAGVASQMSSLQADGGAALRASVAGGAHKDGEPVAEIATPKISDDSASKTTLTQAVSAPSADAQGQQPSFGDSTETGTHLNEQATADPVESKIAKADSSASLDQIFSTDPNSSQAVTSTAVTQQVRNGVLDTLAGTSVEISSAASPSDVQSRTPVPPPVLRTLDLTLSPPDLGSVKLRLSLKSNSLAIEAEASKASTAKILNDDRNTLERGLRDAGYDLSSLKITDASASNSTGSNSWQSGGSTFRDGDQARSNFSGRQDGDMQRREGSTSDQAQRRPKDNNQQGTPADLANRRQGNVVYI